MFNFGKKPDSIIDFIEGLASRLPGEQADLLRKRIAAEQQVPLKFAIVGRCGCGKSSTINSLFNATLTVSHVGTGTIEATTKEYALPQGGTLSVVDMPGLGDSITKDKVFEAIYREILPNVDVVFYVIQADDRALGEDQRILRNIIIPALKGLERKIVIGLNKVDLIGPGNWQDNLNLPSPDQEKNIERRCNDIITKLHRDLPQISKNQIEFYSATRRYRLYDVLASIISAGGARGWIAGLEPKSWFDLATPEIKELAKRRNIEIRH